ncbi:PAS domain-containing protein [Mucilaginibacter roseus]|uniref:histidine kinase n=1 Tax=Mucilaginibacter roseus TaxID=1528868 RepID=A0ABS8U2N1_9SPHI|nr:PAS domain-containing protein [Mucilaginibacter roseus]MCD8740102.1 PAS domain-containing protein [Mucilaginibacter roseus]
MTFREIEVIFDAQPVPCLLLSLQHELHITFANRALANALNAAQSSFADLSYNDFLQKYFKAETRHLLRQSVIDVVNSKEVYPEKLFAIINDSMWGIDTYPMLNEDNGLMCIVQNFHSVGGTGADDYRHKSFDLFNYSPVPTWAYDAITLKFLAANQAAQEVYGYTLEEYLNTTVRALWHPTDVPALKQAIDEKVTKGLPNDQELRLVTKSGEIIDVIVNSKILPSWGPNVRIVMAHDITAQLKSAKEAELANNLERLERRILELNSRAGTPLIDVLNNYIEGIEWIFPEMICSLMRVEDNRLYNWASSSLPRAYSASIEGVTIGEKVGSCGTCAYLKQPVISADITIDDRWDDYREAALSNGLRACWSYPIMNSKNEVVATFGLYYKQVMVPEQHEIKIIERAAALLKVIIENREYAATLEETMRLMTQGQELAHFGNWAWDVVNNKVTWSDTLYSIYGLNKGEFEATFEGYQELLHAEDRQRVYEIISGVLANKQDVSFEERIIRPNGEVRYLRSWGTLKSDSNGMPLKMVGACLDITENKRIEQDLEMLKNRYSDLFQLSPHPMFVYDIETLNYLDVNDAAIQIYGYSTDEFKAMNLLDIRPAEDVPMFKQIIQGEIKQGIQHTGISRHIKRNGQLMSVLTRGNPITYDGRAARIVIAIDYTDKLKAEEALKTSERRFRALIQEGSDLVCIIDSEGNYKYVSPNAVTIAGVTAEELTGTNISRYLSAADAEVLSTVLADISEHQRIELQPILFTDDSGTGRWLQTVITDLRDDPAIEGIVLNSRDVTRRVEQDNIIKEHLERYNIVSKATSDAIWDLNIVTGEVKWNHGINGIFGHRDLNNSYQWWYDRVHPDDVEEVVANAEFSMESRLSRFMNEYRFRCADGSYKTVLDRCFLIFDDDGKPVRMIGAIQDITDRMNYIHAIEHRNATLQEIAWTQSHIVRAPLARIMGLLDLLNHSPCDQDSKLMLEYLNLSAKELDDIIHNIINKSQPVDLKTKTV